MFFSIVVPIYKVKEYLARCIESVSNQDFSDYELLLIDDGSPDDSGKIAESYACGNKKVHVIHKENGGLSDARNVGIKMARGEYIIFLDSDDMLLPNALSSLYTVIKGQDSVAEVYYAKLLRKTGEHGVEVGKQNLIPGKIYSGKEALSRELGLYCKYMAMAQCGIYRRDFLINNRLFFKKGILHEDEEWSPRVALSAQSVMYLDVSFYSYVIREGSITQSGNKVKNARDIVDTCIELREIYEMLDDYNLKKKLLCYLAKMYMHGVSVLLRNGIEIGIDKSFIMGKWLTAKDVLRFLAFYLFPMPYAKIIDAHYIV